MKRIFVLLVSLLIVVFLTGCGKQAEKNDAQGKDHAQARKHNPDGAADEKGDAQKKTKWDGKKGNRGPRKDGGTHNENHKGNDKEIDLNGPDVPQRIKDALKSGRMTPERAKMILKRMSGDDNAPNVKVEPVLRQPIHAFLVLNGTVEPERKVEVYSRLSAYVKEIVKEEGDFVNKNDVIAKLDDTEIRISYRQAEIQLEQAALTLNDEEANRKRSEELKDTEMISTQDFQTAEAAYNKAKLDHAVKLENFKDLGLQLSYTQIKSPAAGYVTERMIEVGSRVNSNQQVFTVEDFSPLLVKVFVPSSDVVNLKLGMESEVKTDVLSGMVFKGNIKLINPRIDVQSGTVKVTVEVFDKTGKLKPGMFVETRVLVSNNPKAMVVPIKCVSYKDDQAYVFVFSHKEGSVAKRVITPGIRDGDYLEVLGGLEDTETIVTVGVESLKDEMKVNVLR